MLPGQVLSIPVKHTTGRYYAPEEVLERMLRHTARSSFATPTGTTPTARRATSPAWPTEAGNVMGLMPHPEHAVDPLTGSADGGLLFESLGAAGARRRRERR